MPGFRQERASQRLHQEISLLFARELSDPRLAGVNVTRVQMSPDLRYARVYVSPQTTPDETKELLEGLRHAAGFIRHRMTQALDLRFAPEFHFEIDRAIEKAERFLQVLAQVEAEERAQVAPKKPTRTRQTTTQPKKRGK